MELSTKKQDWYGMGQAYQGMGHYFFYQNQLSFAQDCYERAQKIGQDRKSYQLIASSLVNLLNIAIKRKNFRWAQTLFGEGMDLCAEEEDLKRVGKLLTNYSALLGEIKCLKKLKRYCNLRKKNYPNTLFKKFMV